MPKSISITKTSQSKLSTVDFDNIPFGKVFSDHMFIADYKNGEWGDFRIVPFGPLEMHPAMMGIHYGQSIFEGMKAAKMLDGTPVFFRPEMHAIRINRSAERMSMPTFPEDVFVQALHELVGLDQQWIPPAEGSALYIRPIMYATDEFIGVKPSSTYRLLIFTGPVGPYYPKPVRLITEQKYVRAVRGGVGEAKAAGNYGGSLLPAQIANSKGFDQVLWLDVHEFKYVQEVGTMNLFFVIDNKVVTPSTNGAILKGITRDSILHILKEKGIEVEERMVSIDEIVEAYKAGKLQEAFGAGTAAVIAHVSDIEHDGFLMELPPMEDRKIGPMLKSEINGLRSGRLEDPYGWVVPVKNTEPAVV
jgi:branched-chain amino acid aminotransferase